MSVHRFRTFCNGNYLNIFRTVHNLSKAETEIELLPKQDPAISQISGITVASVENYSPLTKVSVVIKAGSRYENMHNEGIVHCLRNCSVLSTNYNTSFALTRSLEVIGAKLRATSTREHLIYSLECSRDNTDEGLQILSDVVINPAFKPWEVQGVSERLHVDLALYNSRQEEVLFEALHKTAFRGGLSNSLYAPSFLIGKHSTEMLQTFVKENFCASRTSVIGLGVSHDHLQENVSRLLQMNDSTSSSNAACKFAPGEVRITADYPLVHSAIVAEGASLSNTKERLSFALLQCILGLGSKFSSLGQAAAKCTSNPFYVSGLNVSYSDCGLFGMYIIGLPEDMRVLVKAVVSGMRDISKNISENVVSVAKHKLKANLLMDRETSNDLLSAMALEVSQFGKVVDIKDLQKSIDELEASDVAAIAAKVVKAKPAMASVGRLNATPFVDELL